jgi:ammonia channel protein AmtB
MAETAAAPTGGRALFVRQSSGLVREVSVRNALFYNTAAFIGITVAWAPVFYTLAFQPVGKTAGLTSYAWAGPDVPYRRVQRSARPHASNP